MSVLQNENKILKRSLNRWETLGISVALLAPSMGISINPQGAASIVGKAIPLAYIIAGIAILFVAHSFIKLTSKYHHAGSVYGLVGQVLGARAGALAGWGLAGSYIGFAIVTSIAGGRFAYFVLTNLHIVKGVNESLIYALSAAVAILAYILATRPIKHGSQFLFRAEVITVIVISIIALVILISIFADKGSHGSNVDWSVFKIPQGKTINTMFIGSVFGFLSFGGFEAAATVGEESSTPKNHIPQAIWRTAIFGITFYIILTTIQIFGFGTGDKGVAAYAGSTSLMGDLASKFIGTWLAVIVSLGALISAFSSTSASIVGASRIFFAIGRDLESKKLSAVKSDSKTPATAALTILLFILGIVALYKIIDHKAATLDIFSAFGTISSLLIIFSYFLTVLAALRFTLIEKASSTYLWQALIPLIGLGILGYSFYVNIFGVGALSFAQKTWAYLTLVWLGVAVFAIILLPNRQFAKVKANIVEYHNDGKNF
jgi:amino acid transporter